MDKAWLEREVRSGRSIESISREVGKDASTVGYWMRKYGLRSVHADRHPPRGGIDRETLEALVAQGLSVRAMSEQLNLSLTTVRHWLKRHDLQTQRALQPRQGVVSRPL